jgi:hypothetical protein
MTGWSSPAEARRREPRVNALARLTGTRTLLINAAWLVFVLILHGVGLLVVIRKSHPRDGRTRLAAIGFDVRGLLLELFGPPLALAIVWVLARLISANQR